MTLPKSKTKLPVIKKSTEWLNRAEGLIPAYGQTLAKGPTQHIRGVAPVFLEKGSGSHVWDVDGNEFIDMTMGVGPLSLGYCYPAVDKAITRQLKSGISFSLLHPLEVTLSETIRDIIPNAEAVRFSKTGADVTSAAVRVARAYTGRSEVLCCGYHGWHDWYIGVTPRNLGVPEATREMVSTFDYNSLASVEAALTPEVACVILEPMTFQDPQDGFLQELKGLCERNGSLLIFDEMWTGFRLDIGGAQKYFGVDADLACYSKAIANGMPLSVLCGKQEYMRLLQDDVFFFTTFGGETLSLAAATATIREMQRKPVISTMHETGRKLKNAYNRLVGAFRLDGFSECIGHPSRTMITFDARDSNMEPLAMKSLMQQEMIANGILWAGFNNISYSHDETDLNAILEAYRSALSLVREAIDRGSLEGLLKGEPLQPVFRKTSGFNTKPKMAETR